jgi:CPA2 family monovalent cation:H+ antiporter-2
MSALELSLLMLLAAVLAVVAFRLMRLPPMLGYLVVGILIGPHATGLVPESAQASHLAEFGVVFLMFSIGLEFNIAKLWAMRRTVFGLGLAQVLLTTFLVMGVGSALTRFGPDMAQGMTLTAWFALGGALAMSSTAIIVKLLTERLEMDSAHGRQIVGVLLFQDLAVVPFLVILPALSGEPRQLAGTLLIAFAKAAFVLLLLLGLGQRVLRGWFHLVARRRSQELFMLNLLLVTLGLAWITERAGLSLALGAFIAGMLIAETEYRHQVAEDIKPFRDVLLGLFFITIGMLLNVRVVLEHLPLVLLLLIGPVVGKFLLVTALARLYGCTLGTAIRTGLGLAQAGEFAFVLLKLAGGLQLIDPLLLQVVLASMLLSMLAAPFLLHFSDRIVLRVAGSEWLMQSVALTQIASRSMATQGHVIVCGFGRSGQTLVRLLEAENISYVALDLDPERVREAAEAGDNVVYGDAARREALVAAGIHRAAALVISYANTPSALRVLRHAHQLEHAIPVIVRTTDDTDLEVLRDAGAAEVVPETIEGSLMLASHALILVGVPLSRVVRQVREVREQRYRLFRGFFHGADDAEGDLSERQHVRLHSVVLPSGAFAIGKRVGELALVELGAEITAIRRRGIRGVDPGPEAVLHENDAVVLRGNPDALARAEQALLAQ